MLLSRSTTARPAIPACSRRRSLAVAAGGGGASGVVYTVTLVHPSSGREYVFRAGGGASSRSLYDVASYAGVPLPASCKQGACTACCAKLLSGRVNQTGQTCVPPPLVKEGYVALCVATPVSDVKLMTHQGIAVRNWKSEQPLAEGGRKR